MTQWDTITQLAGLQLSPEEKEKLYHQVQNIIDLFNHISKIPTDSIEPLIHPHPEPMVFREDLPAASSPEENQNLLNQAPSLRGHFVKVPLVVDSEKNSK